MLSSVLSVFHTQTEIALIESGWWLTVVADVPGTKSHAVFPGLFYTLDGGRGGHTQSSVDFTWPVNTGFHQKKTKHNLLVSDREPGKTMNNNNKKKWRSGTLTEQ